MHGSPLYNSRIFRTFTEYLEKTYPHVDIDSLLIETQIGRAEIEDPGHWFSQGEADRFFDGVNAVTDNPHIAREAGRYTIESDAIGPVRQYALSLFSITGVYLLMDKIYSLLSRGTAITTKKRHSRKVEIIATPAPGVREKLYQCDNRWGILESMTKLFSDKFADVQHTECIHRGDDCCRYIITWEKTPAVTWKRIRNYVMLAGVLIIGGTFFLLSPSQWCTLIFACTASTVCVGYYAISIEKKELTATIRMQGNAAQDLIDEINCRYNDILLVREIGQATSSILDKERFLKAVVGVMEKRFDFDRGMIMLADPEEKQLVYAAGYGYTAEQEILLRSTVFHLDHPGSQGIFVTAFRKQEPMLISDFSEVEDKHSERSAHIASLMGVQSLICVPIIYEKKSLGIIAVDTVISKRTLTRSDTSLLMGIASHTAISIMNALSYERLQDSEEKYRELVENANSIILRMTPEGTITFFNEFAQRFFGYPEEEIIGRNVVETILPARDSCGRTLGMMMKNIALYPDQYASYESENMLRDGTRVSIAWTNKAIYNGGDELAEILCIGNDVTDLKKSEQEKKTLQTRLQRAEKMEALGTLAGGVAHDLNNILVGLVSYPELISMQLPEDSHLHKPVQAIRKSGEKAAAIVQDLLTLARRGVAAADVINLNDIICDFVQSPEWQNVAASRKDITLHMDLDPALLNIVGSPVHLSKVIMNLAFNAIEAMEQGGAITISTQNRYLDATIQGFDTIAEGEYATLMVSDTGTGIAQEDIERIFEPFYTKKIMGKSGTGLGLAVVWGTTRDHNGHIDVTSTEGEGTTFSLYFPVTRQDAVRDSDGNGSGESIRGRGESIVVVDDVEEQREIAASILSALGYSVTTLASGEEAVEYVQNHGVDLLVLDMIMDPGIDGYETFKRILSVNPEQKAVIVSGFSESERVKKAQQIGAGVYVKKPYLMKTIAQAVKNELAK